MSDLSAAQLDPNGIGFNTGSNDLWGQYLGEYVGFLLAFF